MSLILIISPLKYVVDSIDTYSSVIDVTVLSIKYFYYHLFSFSMMFVNYHSSDLSRADISFLLMM